MRILCYFKFKGIKYGFGTKFIAVDEFYQACEKSINFGEYIIFSENCEKLQVLRCYAKDKNGALRYTLVEPNDIKEIIEPVYYGGVTSRTQKLINEQKKEKETGEVGELTNKVIVQEKKSEEFKTDVEENFNAWLIYIVAMLVATIFKANIFLWILFTVIFSTYKAYEHN